MLKTKRIFYLVFIVSFFCSLEAASEEAKAGKLARMGGIVVIKKVGAEKNPLARIGDSISVGDLIRTEKDSTAQLAFLDGSFADLSSNTSLMVKQFIYEHRENIYERNRNRKRAIIKLLSGQSRFILSGEDAGESLFLVETEHASVSASDADFVVKVFPLETEVAVLYNAVNVRNISFFIAGEARLRENQLITVKDKAPPSKPSTLTSRQRKNYINN